jgi:MFS family permease
MAAITPQTSFLATRRGKLTLALLCAVGFLDFVDASIVNIALPAIRRDLHFSVGSLVLGPQRLPAHLRRVHAPRRPCR